MLNDASLPTVPNPTLIIPLGKQSIKILMATLPIYYRSDSRRIPLTSTAAPILFDSTAEDGTTGFDVLDYEQLKELDLDKNGNKDHSINSILPYYKTLSDRLSNFWHHLRSHTPLINAGVLGGTIPNINIIVIADFWDSVASLLLLPVLYQLKQFSQQSPSTTIHVLADVARFPDEELDKKQEIRLYRLISEMENRILPKDDLSDDHLLSFMNLPQTLTLDHIRFFVLDTVKENNLTVSNRNEMDAIISSFLLSLFNGEFSNSLTDSLTQDLLNKGRMFFAGCGATSIVYDPDPVVEYCAGRLGAEYLPRDYWPTSGIDKLLVERLQKDVREKLGSKVFWIQRLIKDTQYTYVNTEPEWGLQFSLADLPLELPEPDEFKNSKLVENLGVYISNLINERLPSVLLGLDEDGKALITELVEIQVAFDVQLLQEIELHPNVLINGRKMLQDWKTSLQVQFDDAVKLSDSLKGDNSTTALLNDSIASVQQEISLFPVLPWYLRILPKGQAKKSILRVYSLIRLRKPYRRLSQALKRVKENIELIAVKPVRAKLAALISEITKAIIAEVEATINDIDALERKLRAVQQKLANEYPNHIPGETVFSGHPNFQLFLANPTFTKECYEEYSPKNEDIQKVLLEKMKFLSSWQQKDENELIHILMDYGRGAFIPVRNIKITEALRRTKTLGNDDKTIRGRIFALSESSTCLLNPNFDYSGGVGGATKVFAFVDKETNPIINPMINEVWRSWKIIYTNDPYYYSFARTKDQVPLAAIQHIFKPGEIAWNALTTAEQVEVDVLPGRQVVNPSVTVHDIDDDTVQKIFKWTFSPKGTATSVNQEIKLSISRKRYEVYHTRNRENGAYNVYSEEEMPEIRELTQAFYKLHSDHNWSTYNQAFNILTFVQSCFPYSFDEDSLKVVDWPRYPIETLMDGTGDCEDVAILCGAVLARLGFSSVLFLYPHHLAFGVQAADNLKGDYVLDESTGKKYYYGEATAKGWRLGEIPSSYRGIKPEKIYQINIKVTE